MNKHSLTGLFTLLLITLLAGCTADNMLLGTDSGEPRFLDTNYLTFDREFTDKAKADVKTRADRLCQQRKRVAVETENACTMTGCTTSYQCVTKKDEKAYGLE